MSKGINIRFMIPEGSPLERHLANYTSSRARNYELVRLATNALEVVGCSSLSSSQNDPGAQKLQHSSSPTEVSPTSEGNEKAKVDFEAGFAEMDLLGIG